MSLALLLLIPMPVVRFPLVPLLPLTGSLQPGDILIYANTGGWNGGAHYDHVALYVGNGQAVHGGWNGYSVALASAMTEKLTIVVRIP